VPFQHGQELGQLVCGEGPFVLADHDGVESAIRVRDSIEQVRGLRPVGPPQATAAADVEVFGGDRSPAGDELGGAVALPLSRRGAVLEISGGDPSVECEPETAVRLSSFG
jgi:hypothetical protein